MNNRALNIVLVAVFFLVTAGFALGSIVVPDSEYLLSERRKPAEWPEFTTESLLDGSLFRKYEDYILDRFPFRDTLRGLKAFSRLYIFNQKENNGLYIIDGMIYRLEYPLDEKSVMNAAKKINEIYGRYLEGMNVSYAVIPDKNYFTAAENGYPVMDYGRMLGLLDENINHADYVDLVGMLTIEDYYGTDIHWDQARLVPVADRLLETMENAARASDYDWVRHELSPFRGSLYGQAALPVPPDTLTYLTNRFTENAAVFDYESMTESRVYVPEAFTGVDPYDVFLSGARALITITNPECNNGKELVMFRDSYGSSIAPLLLPGYEKITMIDLRYISAEILGEYVEFNNQDVLFLYNTRILNQSAMLK